MTSSEIPTTAEGFNELGEGYLPGLVGLEILKIGAAHVQARLPLGRQLHAPNGFLHAASIVALADTCCGYGTMYSLPEGAKGFTTLELKSNFLGTQREGIIHCNARAVHQGKSTQIWDAVVADEATDRTVALFRCTQMIL